MKKYIGVLWHRYDRHFGCDAADVYVNSTWNEDNPQIPPMSVSLYKKQQTGRAHDILITAGMSQQPYPFPPDFQGERWSSELIMYFDEVEEEDIKWMFWLSSLPYIDNFSLGFGHTVSHPEPLYKNSNLSNFLFIRPIIEPDQSLFTDFLLALYAVDLLWVVPITQHEYQLKCTAGLDVLFDLLDKNQHPIALNKQRRCYVTQGLA